MDVLSVIKEIKIVPVVVINSVIEVVPTLSALKNGDVPIAEICFRTDCAEDSIKIAVKEFPDMCIGAGTVINEYQCVRAIECGAKFIVSPGYSDKVFEICKKYRVPYIPGALTPTEIMNILSKDIKLIKFFPAGEFGGIKAIKALSSAFPQVSFLPTGGVNNDNLKEFINSKFIYACGGSWVSKGTPEEITKKCLEARKIIKGE